MAWWVINLVIAVQVFIIYTIMVNTAHMHAVISNNRAWVLPWPNEAADITSKFRKIMDDVSGHLFKIARNSRFVVVCIILTIVANLAENPIVHVPFWAGIGFALEHLAFYTKLNNMGELLNQASNEAEQSFCDLIAERVDHPLGEIKE